MHQHASVLPRDERAGDAALLAVELHDGRGQPERNVALQGAHRQPRDERVAVDEARAAAVRQTIARIARHHAGHVQGRLRPLRHLEDVREIVAADHHAAERHHGLDRRPQPGEPRTQLAAVVLVGHQRAAALQGARLVGMVVGPGRRQRVGDERLALEQVQHGGRVVDVGLGLGAVEPVADVMSEVGERRSRESRMPAARWWELTGIQMTPAE